MTFRHHSPEKILIFSTSAELGLKDRVFAIENVPADQNVASARFVQLMTNPVRVWACCKSRLWSTIQAARLRNGDAQVLKRRRRRLFACFQQREQPIIKRNFIVVDKGQVFACSRLHSLITGKRYVGSRLDMVA